MSMNDDDQGEMDDDAGGAGGKRAQSTIRFPYVALDEAEAIADTMMNQYGGQCSVVQLASALDQSTSSGAFRVKVTAAKMFGVIAGRGDALRLTDLGSQLLDQRTVAKARVDAFLGIPLYRAIYEDATSHGGVLPDNAAALEMLIVRLGVVRGQAETARQAFQRSARHAGFHAHGSGRLVMPALGAVVSTEDDDEPSRDEPSTPAAPAAALPGKPPILVEVFKMLPDEGETFDAEARKNWQAMLLAALNMVYGSAASAGRDQGLDL